MSHSLWRLRRPWWDEDLSARYTPPVPALRPDAKVCWCCEEAEGTEYRPGWLECKEHDEGPVRWYGGAAPLALSNGAQAMAWRLAS